MRVDCREHPWGVFCRPFLNGEDVTRKLRVVAADEEVGVLFHLLLDRKTKRLVKPVVRVEERGHVVIKLSDGAPGWARLAYEAARRERVSWEVN